MEQPDHRRCSLRRSDWPDAWRPMWWRFSRRAGIRSPLFARLTLHFHVTGAVPAAAVERAIALSRETYCSVWHSTRQDIEFITRFDIYP
jgi:hypothetical protein